MVKSDAFNRLDKVYDLVEDVYLLEALKYYTPPMKQNSKSFEAWERICELINDARCLASRDLELERENHHIEDVADSCFYVGVK